MFWCLKNFTNWIILSFYLKLYNLLVSIILNILLPSNITTKSLSMTDKNYPFSYLHFFFMTKFLKFFSQLELFSPSYCSFLKYHFYFRTVPFNFFFFFSHGYNIFSCLRILMLGGFICLLILFFIIFCFFFFFAKIRRPLWCFFLYGSVPFLMVKTFLKFPVIRVGRSHLRARKAKLSSFKWELAAVSFAAGRPGQVELRKPQYQSLYVFPLGLVGFQREDSLTCNLQ